MSSDFFQKFQKLPESVKNFLVSSEATLAMEQACILYGLSENEMELLVFPLGDIQIKEKALEDFPAIIMKTLGVTGAIAYGIAYEIAVKSFAKFPEFYVGCEEVAREWETARAAPLISYAEASKKLLELEPWILEMEKEKKAEKIKEEEERKEQLKRLEFLPLIEALKNYPRIGDQKITMNPIKLHFFSALVRPSVRNWISDYHDVSGNRKHDSVERGQYLFHSENGKKLTPGERDKLAVLLKSLDEGEKIAVDAQSQVAVFEALAKVEESIEKSKSLTPAATGRRTIRAFPAPRPVLRQSQEKSIGDFVAPKKPELRTAQASASSSNSRINTDGSIRKAPLTPQLSRDYKVGASTYAVEEKPEGAFSEGQQVRREMDERMKKADDFFAKPARQELQQRLAGNVAPPRASGTTTIKNYAVPDFASIMGDDRAPDFSTAADRTVSLPDRRLSLQPDLKDVSNQGASTRMGTDAVQIPKSSGPQREVLGKVSFSSSHTFPNETPKAPKQGSYLNRIPSRITPQGYDY